MHTLNPTNSLLTLAILGIVAGAIITSSLQVKKVTYGAGIVAGVAKNLTGIPTVAQEQYAGAWQRLKSKSEGQIRDNDKRISKFKAQRASASKSFRAIYDMRVAELERRNIALKGTLSDYKGDKGETGAGSK